MAECQLLAAQAAVAQLVVLYRLLESVLLEPLGRVMLVEAGLDTQEVRLAVAVRDLRDSMAVVLTVYLAELVATEVRVLQLQSQDL